MDGMKLTMGHTRSVHYVHGLMSTQ